MKKVLLPLIMLTLTIMPLTRPSNAAEEKPFVPIVVDAATGALRVPENYREWPMLGVWAHPEELHIVYTQPETITYFKKNGEYPDGAVLVKELVNVETMSMKTGPVVSHATTLKSWFVMVRDTKGRYKESKLWGDGWAWSHFKGRDSVNTVSEDYKKNCIPCHVPARDLARPDAADADKWIYTFGYPVLRDK